MKLARGLAWLIGGLTLLTSGVYFFIYLYVWEFHRGLIVGVIFLAAEVAVVAALVLRRLRSLTADQRAAAPETPDPAVLARLQEAAPARDHFAWLSRRDGTANVFITVLLGGGLVVSGLAWLVERVARGTATPALERDLASRLSTIGFPAGGLIASDGALLAQAGPYTQDPELRMLLGPGASQAGEQG